MGKALKRATSPATSKKNGNSYVILESGNTLGGRTLVGGMIKAARFLRGKRNGSLVFVIVPKKNTTVIAIAKHPKPYLAWLSATANLRDVFEVDAMRYYSAGIIMAIDSKDFLAASHKVKQEQVRLSGDDGDVCGDGAAYAHDG